MTVATHTGMTGAAATPAEVGAKFIRWGLGLFVFGLVIGYLPMAHYMHGSFETVGEAFLKNVTLWWGCAWTLAVYVAQLGSLAMIVIGLCYVVLARDGAMTSVTDARAHGARAVRGRDHCGGCGRIRRLLRRPRGLAELLLRPGAAWNMGLARTASRLHRDLRRRRHLRVRRHQTRLAEGGGSDPVAIFARVLIKRRFSGLFRSYLIAEATSSSHKGKNQ